MPNIIETLNQKILIADGAMGTMLQNEGMPAGVCPEIWMLTNPDKVLEVMTAYVKAGAEVIETNTFGASSLKLAGYGYEDSVNIVNTTAVKLAKQAAGPDRYVAGVIGPSGHFPAPVGDVGFEEMTDVFARQAQALSLAGADLILIQTFSDLGEARAAYLGARKVTNLPVAVSMTYGPDRRTLTGSDPETVAAVFAALGADILGVNCSAGPPEMLEIVSRYRQCCKLPLLAEPNAGLPVLDEGRTVFPMTPEDFSVYVTLFLTAGVRYLGGCCGTTPAHIREIAETAEAWDGQTVVAGREGSSVLTSRTQTIFLGAGHPPRLIGERLNPTARPAVSEALIEGDFDFFVREAADQASAGADLLDVNAGLAGTGEAANLREIILRLQQSPDVPLVIDTVDPAALEQALTHYHGKALVNSVNGAAASLDTVLPLVKRYGAAVVGMTLDEQGVPDKAEDRLRIAGRILDRALEEGIPKEDVYIDCLVMAAATGPESAAETIRAVALIKEKLGLATILGISNISHGMPERSWLNKTYLAHAVAAGADLVFANPRDPDVRKILSAGAFLAGRDPGGARYIAQAQKDARPGGGQALNPEGTDTATDTAAATAGEAAATPADMAATSADMAAPDTEAASQAAGVLFLPANLEALRQAILVNDRRQIQALLQPMIPRKSFAELVGLSIIPALNTAGESFARGDTFLPQLLLTTDGAGFAFEYLQTAKPESSARTLETVVLGTVEGDVHDIGKNIVKALLSSYGYQIVDLGKSVPAEEFIEAVRVHKASVLGLSALMTTTMTEMGPVIRRVRAEGLDVRIIVGGAVLTKEYAEILGADAYVGEAAEAHGVIRRLLDGGA